MGEIADYTIDEPTEPHRFKVGADVFEASAVMSQAARRMLTEEISGFFDADGNMMDRTQELALAETFGRFLDLVLLPASATRLTERLRDPVAPITDKQIANIVLGLIGHYGDRPTEPSLLSSNGRLTDGTSSTAGLLPEA